jgi:thiol-disulfide isomerase/thioredoxin
MLYKNLFIFSLFLFTLTFLSGCQVPDSGAEKALVSQTPVTNKPLPPINENQLTWRLVNGDKQTISDFRGKVLILDFWATYCPPCEEEIPHLVELSNRYKNDLHVVGLHVGGDEDKANIPDFVIKYQMIYALGYPEQSLADFFLQGDDRIPQTFVLDKNGKLIKQFVGFNDQIKTELDEIVEREVKN